MSRFISGLRDFFKSGFNVYLVLFLLLVGIFVITFTSETPISEIDGLVVNYFYLPSCPHCSEQRLIINELQDDVEGLTLERLFTY